MNKPLLLLTIGSMLMMSILFTGCAADTKDTSSQTTAYLTVVDNAGRTVTLPKKPERIVVLSTSFLDLLYAVDGKAIGRPSSKTSSVPQAAQDVPEVGYVYDINLEKVTSLQPDLVIAVQGMHDKLIPTLESSHIPVLVLKYKTLEDTIETIRMLAKIVGTQSKAEEVIEKMQSIVQGITAKLPSDRTTKVAILHATAKSVTVELDTTIAGSIAKTLHLVNIAAGTVPTNMDTDTVPYSLEKVVASDPDVLFVVTMGDTAEIKNQMKTTIESNPSWASLRAVQQKRVYFLPSDLFLLNPGLKMPDAVESMAKLIYPDIYGSTK